MKLLILFGLAAFSAFSQMPTANYHGNGAPALPCGQDQLYQRDDVTPNTLYFCVRPSNSTSTSNWSLLGSGGGGSGDASLEATNQVWTGAGSLTATDGAIVLPIGVNKPLASVATTGGGSKFQLNFDPQTYVGSNATIVDTQMSLGYNRCMNATSCISTEPAWFMGWEDDYVVPGQSSTTNLFNEWYMQFQPTPNGATRPIFVQVHRDATCIAAGNCEINDYEINSSFTVGIGFHSWDNNAIEWATLTGVGLNLLGYSTQAADTVVLARGQNSKFGELRADNGTIGFDAHSVSDSTTIWAFDLLATNNWMQYNNGRTTLGGGTSYTTGALLNIQAATSGSSFNGLGVACNTSMPESFQILGNSSAGQDFYCDGHVNIVNKLNTATSSHNYSSAIMNLYASDYTGSAAGNDQWAIQNVQDDTTHSGANMSTLSISHPAGSSGPAQVAVPMLQLNNTATSLSTCAVLNRGTFQLVQGAPDHLDVCAQTSSAGTYAWTQVF